MALQTPDRENRGNDSTAAQPKPGFKPVALPALAAAIQAAKFSTNRPKLSEPPAILRKNAMD